MALAEKMFKASLEALSTRVQYFYEITEHGIDEAQKMAYLVEQVHDAILSESYRTACEFLTSKIEM